MTDSMAKYEVMRRNGGVPPKEVTYDRFWEMLGVMPPLNWVRDPSDESFAILEGETGNLHTHFVRIYSTHYELVCPIGTKHSDLVKLCMPLFKEVHEKRLQAYDKSIELLNQTGGSDKSQEPPEEKFVIYSPNESAMSNDGAGFWSNKDGWTEIWGATMFTKSEVANFANRLPVSTGSDARFVSTAQPPLSYGEQTPVQEPTSIQRERNT
jgi:hypothetical protein